MVVIDASMALAWLFERSKPEEADCAACLLSSMADVKTVVPTLWHTEIANALLMGERRQVVNEAQVIRYLTLLSYLPITTDAAAPTSRSDQVMGLAREHKLTAYDATYLFFFQAEDGIRDDLVTGVQTGALPISSSITSTSLDWSRSRPFSQPCSKLAIVRDAMPDPLSRFSAAMPDRATPRTSNR